MKGVKAKELEPAAYDYTLKLAAMVRKVAFKKRAPRAIKEIRKFASKVMSTNDVRIDTKLNEFVLSRGIRFLPHRVRVRFNRKRNEADDAKEKFYTIVELVECSNFKGLKHEAVKSL